jgi:single-stranded-DNA-specific exonuclease
MDPMSSDRTLENKSRKRKYKKSQLSALLLKILASRGLEEEKEIEKFLDPLLKEDLHDPLLLPNMMPALDKVNKAIKDKREIIVFGDYDTDGIISSFLITSFLKHLHVDVHTYIPNRFEEGYDISLDFVREKVVKNNYGLLICVDCGTNSHEVRDYFLNQDTGIDVIICDHHQPAHDQTDSDRYIIINPWLKNSQYPFKNLSGAAVTFKFINGILKKMDKELKKLFKKDYLKKLIDLVAITIISDVMPLIDENRVIVHKGLKILAQTENEGIRELLDSNKRANKEISVNDISFIISPRLNASGRLENAKTSLDLLFCRKVETKDIAKKIEILNTERQRIQAEIIHEILCENDFENILKEKKIFIGKSKNWAEGVIGIAASSISKKFNIPVILFHEQEDKLKGSGRSGKSFDLYEKLNQMKSLFIKFGGHKMACGISIKEENYITFKEKMEIEAASCFKEMKLDNRVSYDLEIGFDDISDDFLKEYELLEPFGEGNPEPIFLTQNIEIVEKQYLKEEKHLKLKLKNKDKIFDGIFFNISEDIKSLLEDTEPKENYQVLYCIRKNTYRQNQYIQLVLYDLF